MSFNESPSSNHLRFGPFQLLLERRLLLERGQPVRIGNRAFDLLAALTDRAGEVVSKEELMSRAWPQSAPDEGGLRVHIAALRKALGEGQSGITYITNVPLKGYCFVAPVERPAPPSLRRPKHARPPALPTRLIGRQEEVTSLVEQATQHRLVSLVGPGGIGKTTVALFAAERLADRFRDGLFFVDLASLADPGLLPTTVAGVLDLRVDSEAPAAVVSRWLADKHALLVLDNCEHLIDAVAMFVEQLLRSVPHVHVLATSRERFNSPAEKLVRLDALAAPSTEAVTTFSAAMQFPAFELFVERAMASTDGLCFNDGDVDPITQLCLRLDGIPLAIELVATRIRVFGLAGLLTRLNSRLGLPTLGLRTAIPRHQTLRGTLDWSFELLSPAEQRLLRRLAIFRERFDLASAMSMSDRGRADAAALLTALVDKSLVSTDPSEDGVSYRLLETTRSYCADLLAESGELDHVARLHALHCLDLLKLATEDLERLPPARWRERNSHRVDDVRAALDWAFGDSGDAELGVRLAAESASLWFGLWLVAEYLDRIEHAMARLPAIAVGGELEMRLLLAYAQANTAIRGCTPPGLTASWRCIELARQLNDQHHQRGALWVIFGGQTLLGKYEEALAAAEIFGDVARAEADPMPMFMYHRIKALCLHLLGRQDAALEHARHSLHPSTLGARQLQVNPYQFEHRTSALTQLARILWLRGRPDDALQAAREAVATARTVDHALSLTYALSYAACPISLWCGKEEEARQFAQELSHCVNENSLLFWKSWARLYEHVLARGADALLPEGFNAGHLDMLSTLRPSKVAEETLQRARTGQNAWCAPEVLRIAGEASVDPSIGRSLIEAGLTLAREQGAHGWALRAACSLARLQGAAALPALDAALAHCVDGLATYDLVSALELRARLS